MPITLDGNLGVIYPDVTTQNTSAVISGKLPTSKLPTGSVLQVVSTADSTQRSTSSGTMTASGCSVTITPTSATSKIFVTFSSCIFKNTDNAGYLTIYRGATNLAGSSNQFQILSQPDRYIPCVMSYLDSPASTSALTYEVYYYRTGSLNIYIGATNTGASISTLTVMEIAG